MMKSYLPIAFVLFFFGCGSDAPENPDTPILNDSIDSVYTTIVSPDLNPLPSPLQIAFLFKSAGLEYMEDAGNDVANSANYSTSTLKQLNLGAYSADFAYCALNQQRQAGTAYLQTIDEMADQLGLAGVYNTAENRERFEANADNIDSVAQIISELQIEADQYFLDNNEQGKAFAIFAGAWVESMYLGAKTRDLSDNPAVATTLLEQADILKDLLAALNTIEADETLSIVIGNLKEMDGMFDSMLEEQTDADELVVSADKLYQLINLIFTTRKSIVNG